MNGSRLGTDFKLGSTVTYRCNSGYTAAGPPTITCIIGADGKPVWDKALPTCKGKSPVPTACIDYVVSRLNMHLKTRQSHICL